MGVADRLLRLDERTVWRLRLRVRLRGIETPRTQAAAHVWQELDPDRRRRLRMLTADYDIATDPMAALVVADLAGQFAQKWRRNLRRFVLALGGVLLALLAALLLARARGYDLFWIAWGLLLGVLWLMSGSFVYLAQAKKAEWCRDRNAAIARMPETGVPG